MNQKKSWKSMLSIMFAVGLLLCGWVAPRVSAAEDIEDTLELGSAEAVNPISGFGNEITLNVNQKRTLYLDIPSGETFLSALWDCNSSDLSLSTTGGSSCTVEALRYTSFTLIVDCKYYCLKTYTIGGRSYTQTISHYASYSVRINQTNSGSGSSGSGTGTGTGTGGASGAYTLSCPVTYVDLDMAAGAKTLAFTAGVNLSDSVYIRDNSPSGKYVAVECSPWIHDGNKADYDVWGLAPGTQTVKFELIYKKSASYLIIKDSITIRFRVTCSHSYDGGKVTVPPTATTTGTKVYTCKECGNTKTETIPVVQNAITECRISLSETEYVYDGTEHKPAVTVQHDGSELAEGKDYEILYQNNINAGTATVKITGAGDYSGTVSKSFTIKKAAQNLKISVPDKPLYVNGTLQISAEGTGTISYSSGDSSIALVDAAGLIRGKARGKTTITVTASGNENYGGTSRKVDVCVTEPDPARICLSQTSVQLKTGESKEIMVTAEGTLPSRFTFSIAKDPSANFSAAWTGSWKGYSHALAITGITEGRGKLPVYLKDSETGTIMESAEIEVSVERKVVSISDCEITLAESEYVYDGTEKKPMVSVSCGYIQLIENYDYFLDYSNNVNAGKATVTVTGTGAYTGTLSKTFTIGKAMQNFMLLRDTDSVEAGDTVQIRSVGAKTSVMYSSKDSRIATVNSNGVVTGVRKGKTEIVVTASGDSNYHSASKTFEITVTESSSGRDDAAETPDTEKTGAAPEVPKQKETDGGLESQGSKTSGTAPEMSGSGKADSARKPSVNTKTKTVSEGSKPKAKKIDQKFRLKKNKYVFKKSSLKRRSRSFKIQMLNRKGAFSCKCKSGYIKITGRKVTIKRGIPRGTYKIKVRAEGNARYNPAVRTIKIIIR